MDFNVSASQANLANQFKNVKIKLTNTTLNIKFNKDCLKLGIKPKYVHVNIKNQTYAAKKTKASAEKLWLKNEIKFLYSKKSMLNTLLYKTYLELSNAVHPSQLDSMVDKINALVFKAIKNKKSVLRKKLNRLVNEQKSKEDVVLFDFKFFPRIVNNTKIVFDSHEQTVLEKGLNYNLPKMGKKRLFDEIINAECAIKAIPQAEDREAARVSFSNKLKRKQSHPNHNSIYLSNSQRRDLEALKRIKQKLLDNHAMLCKCDKGNSTVVLYKQDYISKVNDFIQNNEVTQINHDPTAKFQRKIKTLINKSNVLFSDNEIKHLKAMNPTAPSLRGLPKVHKPNVPIRPLVNYTSAPSYKLAKKLETILKNNIILEHNHSVKNSFELINSIQNLEVKPHQLLASFDVVNLYTNVPVAHTIALVKDNLETHSNMLPEAINECIELLTEVLKQNYFIFDNKLYMQNDGLAMGSPLSGILSDIYLNDIENKHIFSDKNKQKRKILAYKRYVDDTFLAFNGNVRQLELLKNYLNNISPKLKFTLETESSNKLNFLDLTLEKRENKIDFSIFRKPTTSDQTIHSTSYHPYSQKLAAYRSMVHRLLSVPLTQLNYNKELNIIKHIALANGYKSEMINRLITKHQTKNELSTVADKKYVCVEFNHNIQHGIGKELRKHNIELSFRTTNKTSTLTNDGSDRPNSDKSEKTGVYKLNCADCPSTYIGQTGRPFKLRFSEHVRIDPKLKQQRSSFGQHLIENLHSVNGINNSVEILHICPKNFKLDCLEEFEIYKLFRQTNNKDFILNEKLQFKSNRLYNLLLYGQHKSADHGPTDNNDRTAVT